MKFKSITLAVAVGLLVGTSGSVWNSGNNIAHASASSPQVRSILPNNDRTQIFDTLNGHYQSVCFIYVNNAIQGSGVVVGPNTILTNRHVVSKANSPQNIRIAPARKSQTEVPFGGFEASDFIVNEEEDLAVVHVSPKSIGSIGEVVTPAKIVNNPSTSVGDSITVTGYPGDKPFGTMWESKGKVVYTNDDTIRYNASTSGGNSGSPLFNDKNEVVGIHHAGGSTWNAAVRFRPSIYNFIQENIK